jgi:hypothetical protein
VPASYLNNPDVILAAWGLPENYSKFKCETGLIK